MERDFYVDDGLKSLPSSPKAMDLLERTQEMLAVSNLRLHKIASNDPKVLEAFLPEDHTKGLQNLDFDDSSDLTQRSLGLNWVKAIAAVAYLKVIDSERKCHIGFVLGKEKLAPTTAHTVPRLELGAAVLAVELTELVKSKLDISVDSLQFYTDSKVLLGFIHNQTTWFYVYVSERAENRVQRIRKSIESEQWHYVCTTQNPADHATRSVFTAELPNTTWLTSPPFLSLPERVSASEGESYDLFAPDLDTEVPSHATTLSVSSAKLGCQRFERFSSWKSLVRAIAF